MTGSIDPSSKMKRRISLPREVAIHGFGYKYPHPHGPCYIVEASFLNDPSCGF